MNLEGYRQEHESQTEWNMRREFLEVNWGHVAEERLICLSHCLVNIEFSGCRYPPAVHEELARYTTDITPQLQVHRNSVRARQAVKFMKSSNDEEEFINSLEKPSTSNTGNEVQMKNMTTFPHMDKTDIISQSSTVGSIPTEVLVKRKVDPTPTITPNKYMGSTIKRPKLMFVKATSEFHSTDVTHVSQTGSMPDAGEICTAISGSASRLSAPDTVTSNEPATLKQLTGKFLRVSQKIDMFKARGKNAVEFMNNLCMGNQMTHRTDYKQAWDSVGQFTAEVFIDDVLVGTGKAAKKKEARHHAFDNALETLKRKFMIVKNSAGPGQARMELASNDKPFQEAVFINNEGVLDYAVGKSNLQVTVAARTAPGSSQTTTEQPIEPTVKRPTEISYASRPAIKFTKPSMPILTETRSLLERWQQRHRNHRNWNIANFVLRGPMGVEWDPLQIVCNSVSADPDCKGEFITEATGPAGTNTAISVTFKMAGEVIAVGRDAIAKEAKRQATELALPLLQSYCWSLKNAKPEGSEVPISKGALADDGSEGSLGQAINKNNIGSKLLQKIGWTGGGLGKKESGRTQPVNIDSVINRQGLGFQGDPRGMKNAITKVIEDYIKASKTGDMAFSAEFTNEERKVIHDVARRLGLKSKSYNTDNGRYLVVSRKRTIRETIEYVLANTQEATSYKVIPPTCGT